MGQYSYEVPLRHYAEKLTPDHRDTLRKILAGMDTDGRSPTLTVTCEDDSELDTICAVLTEAEEQGAIEFGFGVQRN